MAGLQANTPIPTDIVLHETSRLLEVSFDNGQTYKLPFEFLRVFSPSAEVQGHGPGQEVLDRKSTRLNSSHSQQSRMPSSA